MNFCEIMKFFMWVLQNIQVGDAKLVYKFDQPKKSSYNYHVNHKITNQDYQQYTGTLATG